MNEIKVWAPNALSVELVKGDEGKSSYNPPIILEKTTSEYKKTQMEGYWGLPNDVAFPLKDGDGYWFKLTLKDESIKYRIDPYSRAVRHSGSCSIYKDPDLFEWSDQNFKPPRFEEMVIYQVFQGAYAGKGDSDWLDSKGQNYHFEWSNKRKGDFIQLKNKLDYIQSLGVNTIELLPVNEYNNSYYIGYSSISFFAIESSYGEVHGNGSSYDNLKVLINEAHKRGIAVIADVVYNHFGTAGDSGAMWNYDSKEENIYFSGEEASNQCGGTFGMAPNWAKYEVQKYIEDSCNYFLDELHFDGLRFDFTSQIVNKNRGSGENSGAEVLRRIISSCKEKSPNKLLICEHWDEYTGSYSNWMTDYIKFDAGWFNFRKGVQECLWPFASGKEEDLKYAINGGDYTSSTSRIVYGNSHDECWWDGRNKKEKFYPVSEFHGWRGDEWSKRKARMLHSLSFFIPGIPMFFMGDEFAMEGCFNDYHRDHILNWELEKIEPGPSFKRMFKRLIEIKKSYSPLKTPGNYFEWLYEPHNGWFAFKRKVNADVLIVAGNYSGEDYHHYSISTNGETGNWMQIFNSEGQEFGGNGFGNYQNNPNSDNGEITINIPKNGIVVMTRTSIN